MKKRYCMSCGERKRLTYPKVAPTCCTMRCAAENYECIVSADYNDTSYACCTCCGAKPPSQCEGWEGVSEEEEAGIYGDL